MEKDAEKPSCVRCHVQNVCFMPKMSGEFQKNFKPLSDDSVARKGYQEIRTYLEIVAEFNEFIARNCRFYKEIS